MKRLNNNGWGLERMLILVSFMIFLLLVIAIMVYRLYWFDDIDLVDKQHVVEKK
ncbi:MAG: hypothetical protein IJF92_02300 [Bacilli bacterium]|nr:hypothetical protein [Bacilli bacterium]